MGINQSYVSNQTGKILHIAIFNNSNPRYWSYPEFQQVPDDGDTIKVSGRVGGAAVKVGVIYKKYRGRIVFDLFHVDHGQTLIVNTITEGSGVMRYNHIEGRVYRLARGMSSK